jgi:hypothetical protein
VCSEGLFIGFLTKLCGRERGSNFYCVLRVCSNVFNKIMWMGERVIYSV